MQAALRLPTARDAEQAAERIFAGAGCAPCIRSPLIRCNFSPPGGPNLWLKLETLQSVGSFKMRGAGNAVSLSDPGQLRRGGLATASAGNMGQGVAYHARHLRVPCTVVVPESAPRTKVAAIERLGGTVKRVPFDEWWRVIETGECPQVPDGVFIHPVLDQRVIAGNATIALEIARELPSAGAVVIPYGGGALACGVAGVLRELLPGCKAYAAEPATAAPVSASLRAGRKVPAPHWAPSFVDGCGGKAVLPPMWPLAREVLAGGIPVPLEAAADAVRLLCERQRVVAEGAGACSVAAALSGAAGGAGTDVVCIVSGGCIDTPKLCQILSRCPRATEPQVLAAACPRPRL